MRKNTYETLRILSVKNAHLREQVKALKQNNARDLNIILHYLNSIDKALANTSQLDLFKEQAE